MIMICFLFSMVHMERITLKHILLITMVMDHMGMAQVLRDMLMDNLQITILGMDLTWKFIWRN